MAKGKKTGGRTLGVKNKETNTPSKVRIKRVTFSNSEKYYCQPLPPSYCAQQLGWSLDQIPPDGLTRFEIDLELITPIERITAQGRLLNKSVPDLKAVDANINTSNVTLTIEQHLQQLCLDNQ